MSKLRQNISNHRPDFHTVENFRDFIEAAEIARDFLIANTPQKVRLALIVLDNTAELLMSHLCSEIFADDEFRAKLSPPRFSQKLKAKTRDFLPKVELLRVEAHITDGEASVLRLGHSYRNPAFHQGRHNPRAISAVSILLFKTVSAVMQRAFSGVSIGGFGEIGWLRDYGVSTAPLAFAEAAAHIMEQLARGLRQPLDQLKAALGGDLADRLGRIDRVRSDGWYSLTTEQWDDAIKYAQFLDFFDDEAAAAKYREFVYKITEQMMKPDGQHMTGDEFRQLPPVDPVFRENFLHAKAEYEARSAEALSSLW